MMIVAAAPMIAQMRKFLAPALVYQIVRQKPNSTAPIKVSCPSCHGLTPLCRWSPAPTALLRVRSHP
jgi:hypothetical protein